MGLWYSFKGHRSRGSALLTTIDPLFTEPVAKAFLGIFGATKGRALDILNHRLSKVRFKVEKKDVVDVEMEAYPFSP